MKLTTIATALVGAGSIVSAAATPQIVATPSTQEFAVDITERGIVDSLISGVEAEIPKLLGSINYESISGWANNLLTKDDNVKYLDDLLIGLKDLNILEPATMYLIDHNYTRHILGNLLDDGLHLLEGSNSTILWVALDKSGLAYGVVAGVLEDPNLLPFVVDLVKDLLSSGAINFSSILSGAESAIEGAIKSIFKRDLDARLEEEPSYANIQRRDNIEDLLTTIFASTERSGLIEQYISALLADPKFESEIALLLEDYFRGFHLSSITSIDLSKYKPLINSITQSGLLGDLLKEAISDKNLLNALLNDVGSLFKKGNITTRDLVSREVAEQYGLGDIYDLDAREVQALNLFGRAENATSTNGTSSTNSTKPASSSSSKSSSTSTSSASSGAGSIFVTKSSASSYLTALLGATTFATIMLI